MLSFTWGSSGATLQTFGGEKIALHVPKTGLPYFDALRLYGAIDLYIGIREDVSIRDAGTTWIVQSKTRRGDERVAMALAAVKSGRKPLADEYVLRLREMITGGRWEPEEFTVPIGGAVQGVDAAMQCGIRGVAALDYATLQTSQTSRRECQARIALRDAVLAYAGKRRTENFGSISYLPLFEGPVDLGKVVSPVRARGKVPNVVCGQALILLMLKTSLFAEGYQERLTGIAFTTTFPSQKAYNFSGMVDIRSTAIGRMKSSLLVSHVHEVLSTLISRAWQSGYEALQPPALAIANWLMHPSSKHLGSLVTSQEVLRRGISVSGNLVRIPTFFDSHGVDAAKEAFEMSYEGWDGDYDAVRVFARAVAQAIYYARMRKEQKKGDEAQGKAWYDEVTMLRSASSPQEFFNRALLLLEQGHREERGLGTETWGHAYDPSALFASLKKERRSSFEAFRTLFRMYLIQESKPYRGEATGGSQSVTETVDVPDTFSEERSDSE